MGQSQILVVPEPDARLLLTMKAFKLTPQDMARFYSIFDKLDSSKTGLLSIQDFFRCLEYERNAFTDQLMLLVDIDINDEEVNFSEFVVLVCTYCFFGVHEILRFCLYVFDEDDTGCFDADNLRSLIRILNNVPEGGKIGGQARISLERLTVGEGGKYDFEELKGVFRQFPKMFQPAFALQLVMMKKIMGEKFWESKKNLIRDEVEEEKQILEKEMVDREREIAKYEERKVRRRMGFMLYYVLPCFRYIFAHDSTATSDDDEAKRLEKLREDASRKAALEAKNPETPAWHQFKRKLEKKGESVVGGTGTEVTMVTNDACNNEGVVALIPPSCNSKVLEIQGNDERNRGESTDESNIESAGFSNELHITEDPAGADVIVSLSTLPHAVVHSEQGRKSRKNKKRKDKGSFPTAVAPKTLKGAEKYIMEQYSKSENPRRNRVDERAQRRAKRLEDPHLKYHFSTTVSKVDV